MDTKKATKSRSCGKKMLAILFLAAACAVSTLVSLCVGTVSYSFGESLRALVDPDSAARLIVWNVRLPRILCGGMVGVCLSLAGCILQGVMRNHLASPSTIGVTSGASFMGYLTLVAFPQYARLLPAAAILGSLDRKSVV